MSDKDDAHRLLSIMAREALSGKPGNLWKGTGPVAEDYLAGAMQRMLDEGPWPHLQVENLKISEGKATFDVVERE